jgi:uncharacterized hydrophobic protein (TIGR00271 family)
MKDNNNTRRSIWRVRISYFLFRRWIKPLSPERRGEIQVQMRDASRPDFSFFLLTVLSCIIATQGLLVNSSAVIIGAMLVAPLMSPIIGLGLASITGDTQTLRDGTSALVRGALLAVLMSFLITLMNRYLPFIVLQDLPNEVISRTHPGPIDLGVAMAGGIAAAFAMAMPNISAALPGVAIATALMPPLCTIGIGLAVGRLDVAGGATLLFIVNTFTIAFASSFVFYGLGFSGPLLSRSARVPRSLLVSSLVTFVLLGSLSIFSYKLVQRANENRQIETILKEEINKWKGVQLVEWDAVSQGDTINLNIVVRTLSQLHYEDSVAMQKAIANRLQQPVAVAISQVFAARLDPLVPPSPTFTPTTTFTFTPGPSPTFTSTPTNTPTLTPTPTETSTATPTPTETPTSTPTPTPALAKAVNTALPGLRLRQYPSGPEIAVIHSGQLLTVLYGVRVVDGLVWVEVQDADGRIGWIPQVYLSLLTPTPTETPKPTSTFSTENTVELTPFPAASGTGMP